MNQLSPSALLVGALLAGFVLWLAKSNRLGAYYGLLFASAPASSSGGSSSGTSAPAVPFSSLPGWLNPFNYLIPGQGAAGLGQWLLGK